MKARNSLVIVAIALLVSCSGQMPSSAHENTAAVPVNNVDNSDQEISIPQINIEQKDKACITDSDCLHVMTQCSCDCGDAVNKAHRLKYSNKLDKACRNYDGKMCKINCDANSVICKNQSCEYTSS